MSNIKPFESKLESIEKRLKAEGNETVTSCNGLKMIAPDGKKYLTEWRWQN